jgi:hypothetical protein
VSSIIAACGALAACGADDPPPIEAGPPASCPTHLDLELIGRESRFNAGWSGLTHGVGLATGSRFSVEVVSCDEECRRCRYRGPVRADPARHPVVSQRCLNGVSQICEIDDDCAPGTGPCRFMFPPITVPTGALPTCSIPYFEPIAGDDPSPVQGTSDLFTGEADLPVLNLNIQVAAGTACVECQGDPQPFDGVPGGACGGPGGPACDIAGIGTVASELTSYDCEPAGFLTLTIPLPASGTSTASRRWTLDDTRPMCTSGGVASTTERCFCGVCMNGKPCTSKLDCPTGACGYPGMSPTTYNVSNNGCGGTCNWSEATQRGTCSDAPTKSCFPDGAIGQALIATGEAAVRDGFLITQLANLTCLPSFGNAGIDQFGGFPGPVLFEARFRVEPRSVMR